MKIRKIFLIAFTKVIITATHIWLDCAIIVMNLTNGKNMEKRIQNDLMAAMKAKDEVRAQTLRSVKAAILNEKSNGVHHELTDQDIVKLINKQIKLRKDAADIYTSSNRPDLAEKELNELHVLEEYVPKKMNEEETRAAIEAVISETGVSSQKEKGKLIGALRQKYGETLDMQIAVPIITSILK